MRLEDIARIEAELGVRLPEDYRTLMRDYPFPPDSFTAEFALTNDASHLIEINRERITQSPLIKKGREGPPASHFEIGGDGGEESYLIDLSQPESPVYVYDLETDELRVAAPRLNSFVARCAAADEQIRRDEESVGTKPWWQFWK